MIRFRDTRCLAVLARFAAGLLAIGLSGQLALAQKTASFPRVTRGAYLQSGTPTSIIVRWRTPVATESVVRYGLDPATLDQTAASPGRLKDHVVLLSGLSPDTRYFYSVGTSNRVLQAGSRSFFRTSPAPDSTQPIRVWVLGDPGTGYPVQRAVRDAYQRTAGTIHTDLVLTLGDNAYGRGTGAQYDHRFFDVYRDELKRSILWPALGNHDALSACSATESGVYYNLFELPRQGQAGGVPSGTEEFYSFDYGNAHFICLNSHDSDLAPSGLMLSWLRRDLASNARTWTIAYWHHPPYSKGSHDSDCLKGDDARMTEMREKVLPLLEAGGADLVLCGHSHLYERSFPLRGHYGKSDSFEPSMITNKGDGSARGTGPSHFGQGGGATPDRGIVYVNAGSAGHATKKKDLHGLNHPAMAVSMNVPGSLFLDIAGPRLRAVFIDDKGVERDSFTLTKGF